MTPIRDSIQSTALLQVIVQTKSAKDIAGLAKWTAVTETCVTQALLTGPTSCLY